MPSLSDLARRLAALEAKRKPGEQSGSVWFAVQLDRGLSADDALVAALADHAGQSAVRAFRDPDSLPDPAWWPSVCAAIGVGPDATADDVLAAARSGLRRDAAAYRSRVLAAYNAAMAEEREQIGSRYDPATRTWVFKTSCSPEQWGRSLPMEEAARRCMAMSQATSGDRKAAIL